jgi:hypothetical protein
MAVVRDISFLREIPIRSRSLDQPDQIGGDAMKASLEPLRPSERVEMVGKLEETGVVDDHARLAALDELLGMFVHDDLPLPQEDDLPLRAREPFRDELDVEVLPGKWSRRRFEPIEFRKDGPHPLLARQLVQQPPSLECRCVTVFRDLAVRSTFLGEHLDGGFDVKADDEGTGFDIQPLDPFVQPVLCVNDRQPLRCTRGVRLEDMTTHPFVVNQFAFLGFGSPRVEFQINLQALQFRQLRGITQHRPEEHVVVPLLLPHLPLHLVRVWRAVIIVGLETELVVRVFPEILFRFRQQPDLSAVERDGLESDQVSPILLLRLPLFDIAVRYLGLLKPVASRVGELHLCPSQERRHDLHLGDVLEIVPFPVRTSDPIPRHPSNIAKHRLKLPHQSRDLGLGLDAHASELGHRSRDDVRDAFLIEKLVGTEARGIDSFEVTTGLHEVEEVLGVFLVGDGSGAEDFSTKDNARISRASIVHIRCNSTHLM